ncbi:MAG TPA: DUF2600 family protein, partial [Solirubrobacteraceae bacterium]|nr:DUF2600 family protein [Solirubrobacteraceae bacterium]
ALIDALDPSVDAGDYYKHHAWSRDDGYLCALVQTCRDECGRLPSYKAIKPLALRAARLTQVLGINHEPDPELRDASLQAWAATHLPNPAGLAWWERTGAASAWLTVLALLALSAEPAATHNQGHGVYAAYLPWISLAGTMLDSYGDLADDATAGNHSYIAHYPDTAVASQRIADIVRRSLAETRDLRDHERHLVITTCMIAMYLTKDSTRGPALRATTSEITRASGSLTRCLVPVLRAWRLLYKQQST